MFPDQNDGGHLNITYEASQGVFLDQGDGGVVNISFPLRRLLNIGLEYTTEQQVFSDLYVN